ncbi:MAG: NAD(P)-dependent alcohol dehydrogenase [Actinomycetes bacterium]
MMKTHGYAATAKSAPLTAFEFDRRELRSNDVAFDIAYAGICHSDIHQVREEWGPSIFPMVPGHEIVGTVTSVGSAVTKFQIGDLVGVGVFVDSCGECEECLRGLQNYCANGMTGTYNGYERDGTTVAYGGYSNKFVVDANYAVKVPANLDLTGVAPLMCAGITLYSPLKHWQAGPGKKVGIIGLGGLGHMGLKFAKALGAHTTVFSHSPSKESDARNMGADDFVVTNDPKTLAALPANFDLILNTVSADLNLEDYLRLLKIDATLVVIGLPGKPYSVGAGTLLSKRRSLAGSMIGGMPELQEMIDFCGRHNILSEVEVIKADYINEAYERTVASDVKYRFVIDASTF